MGNEDLIKKIKGCKTVEDLKTISKEIGYDLTDDEAKVYFDKYFKSGELTDEELSNVNGGCAKWRNGKAYSGVSPHLLIVTWGNSCRLWEGPARKGIKGTCFTCDNIDKAPGSAASYCKVRNYYNDPLNPKK